MFRRHYQKRSSNPLFVIFRLFLSLIMFGVLLIGTYTAYKHFSGLDPLKLDPLAVINNLAGAKTPQQFITVLSSIKPPQLPSQISNQVLGQTVKQNDQAFLENLGKATIDFRFLLIADSHNDSLYLRKALDQAKQAYPDLQFIIGLGDYTDVGTIEELKKAKNELDLSGLRYFLLAGDHDLWDSRDKNQASTQNFNKIFGSVYQSFIYNGYKFLLIDNSDNYKGIGDDQQKWIVQELERAKDEQVKGILVFIHEPLFHPSAERVMGKVEKELKYQAKSLIYQLRAAGVQKVISGDIHYFSEYEEPETKLSMVTVGALGIQRNPQVPRYAVVSVYDNGEIKVEDREIK